MAQMSSAVVPVTDSNDTITGYTAQLWAFTSSEPDANGVSTLTMVAFTQQTFPDVASASAWIGTEFTIAQNDINTFIASYPVTPQS